MLIDRVKVEMKVIYLFKLIGDWKNRVDCIDIFTSHACDSLELAIIIYIEQEFVSLLYSLCQIWFRTHKKMHIMYGIYCWMAILLVVFSFKWVSVLKWYQYACISSRIPDADILIYIIHFQLLVCFRANCIPVPIISQAWPISSWNLLLYIIQYVCSR